MRKRLYFLLSNTASAHQIVNELLLARIDESHIHVMAKDGISLEGLPKASLLQSSDIIHGIETGLVVGGLTGLVVGMVAAISFALEAPIGIVILACTLLGTLLGVWIASMIGSDVRNSRLKSFEKAMEAGEILLMVDVPANQARQITNMIDSHKEVHQGGTEPTIPAFP